MSIVINGTRIRSGGGLIFASKLIISFQSRGRKAIVFASDDLNNYLTKEKINLCNISLYKTPRNVLINILYEIFIISFFVLFSKGRVFTLDATTFLPLKKIWTVHQDILPYFPEYSNIGSIKNQIRNKIIRWLQYNTLRRSEVVFFQSEFARSIVQRSVPISKSFIIPHGLNRVSGVGPKSKPNSKFLQLVCISPIYYYKNYSTVLNALFELKKLGIKVNLRIVGGVGDKKEYKKLVSTCQNLGLCDDVQFTGHMEHRQVLRLMNEADALVFASLCETFGITLLEAISVDTPVIAANIGYINEILLDHFPVFDACDPTDLARVVSDFLQQQSKYRKAEAFESLRQRFDWSRILDRYHEVITEYDYQSS